MSSRARIVTGAGTGLPALRRDWTARWLSPIETSISAPSGSIGPVNVFMGLDGRPGNKVWRVRASEVARVDGLVQERLADAKPVVTSL